MLLESGLGKNLDSKRTYIALAGPSMIGKTQSAFTFNEERVIPLYFVFNDRQYLYENFHPLTKTLIECADADMNTIGVTTELNDSAIAKERLSTGYLSSYCEHVDMYVLGLFKSLIELATDQRESYRDIGWMKFLAKIDRLLCPPISLKDFSSFVSTKGPMKFVPFLDEFKRDNRCVFVRNISRAVGLRCVVANTNTNITNLVGPRTFSRQDEEAVWALVITKLDSANFAVLDCEDGTFDGNAMLVDESGKGPFSRNLDLIKANFACEVEADFFVNWFKAQIVMCRPGMAAIFAACAAKLVNELPTLCQEIEPKPLNTSKVLDYLLKNAAEELKTRKPNILSLAGHHGTLGLTIPENVNNAVSFTTADENSTGPFNHVDYLNDHLYYLCNPCDPDDWRYLVILQIRRTEIVPGHIDRIKKKISFTNNHTYFPEYERLTMMACWFLQYVDSVFSLSRAAVEAKAKNQDSFGFQSGNDIRFDGNYLEIVAAYAVVQASHAVWDNQSSSETCTVESKSGLNFIQKFIEELLSSPNSSEKPCILQQGFKIYDFLGSIKIPFIYSINRVDSAFEDIGLVSYTRTKASEQIDGRFDMGRKDDWEFVSVECKNYQNAINKERLTTCIKKALKHQFAIILGTRFVGEPEDITEIKRICAENQVNLYRYCKLGGGQFAFVPFEGLAEHDDPNCFCLMIEMNRINSSENV